jgi:hypothetical protein
VGGSIQSTSGTNGVTLGGAVTYIDRPTITYTPLTGSKFIHMMVTPIPPESLFSAIQAGFPADTIMLAGVASINGLKNQQRAGEGAATADDRFMRAIELMRKIQLADAMGVRVQRDAAKNETTLLTFHTQNIAPETQQDIAELRQLLKLPPDGQDYTLVFGGMPADGQELAVETRSMMHILSSLASQVDVPPADQAAGRVNPGWDEGGPGANRPRLIHISSAEQEPKDAFVEIYYRKHWFWISDDDLKSKHMFSLIMLLFTLGDDSQPQSPPVLTIPTQ